DGAGVASAREVLPRLQSEYERAYYNGIICERWAKALRTRGVPGSGATAYQWLQEAMEHYEEAEKVRPAGNDDALLRWNACARTIARHPDLKPAVEERADTMLEERRAAVIASRRIIVCRSRSGRRSPAHAERLPDGAGRARN